MNKQINLTLIFPKLKNVDLLKDMGFIPYLLTKNHNYNSSIISYQNEKNYSYFNTIIKNISLKFIPKVPFSTYWYLLKNAKKIDILMLIHISSSNIYLTLWYKFLNPNGYVYLKGDLSAFDYATKGKSPFITYLKRAYLLKKFIKNVNLVSYENTLTLPLLNAIPENKKLHIPNGFYDGILKPMNIRKQELNQKENIIFFPAKHGTYAKNSEFLLNILESFDLKEWKIVFAGNMTNDFIIKKEKLLKKSPKLGDSLLFLGNIVDKKEFYEWYQRSKYTILTSRWEGFPLVSLEALYFGNVLLLSKNIMSSYDLTNNNKIGFTFNGEDTNELKVLLTNIVSNKINFEEEQKKSLRHFTQNYKWTDLVEKLNSKITKDMDSK